MSVTNQNSSTISDSEASSFLALDNGEVKTIMTIFHQFDTDHNGAITKEELTEALQGLGVNPSEETVM
jgi:Ca2+-binding EF-hand superfamily protein